MLSIRIFLLSLGMVVLMAQFQNCASVSTVARHSHPQKPEIAFLLPQTEVYDEAESVLVSGVCGHGQNGEILNWSLQNNEGVDTPIDSGVATCRDGDFKVKVEMNEDLICGLSYPLSLQTEGGLIVRTQISKRCQPLASQKLPSVAGNQCVLEYNLNSRNPSERLCEKVCYSAGRLVSSEQRSEADCQGLASNLAGR